MVGFSRSDFILIGQHSGLQKHGKFYTQFALAVAEICNDPQFGLEGKIAKVQVEVSKAYRNSPQFTITGNSGKQCKIMLQTNPNGREYYLAIRSMDDRSWLMDATFVAENGYDNLTKDQIRELQSHPQSFPVRSGEQALAGLMKRGLGLEQN